MKMPTTGSKEEIYKYERFLADKRRFIKKLGVRWVIDHYGSSFYELMDIFNKYDPAILYWGGCPPNEYDLEVATIIIQLNHEMSVQEICNVVKEDLAFWFGVDVVMLYIDRYPPMVKEIHEWMRNGGLGVNRYPTW